MDSVLYRFTTILLSILFINCSNSIKPEESGSDISFEVSANYNENKRITDTLHVHLNWSNIIVDNYRETVIKRYNHNREPDSYPTDETEDGWKTITRFNNEFTTNWIDTVYDDARFTYRVFLYDQNYNYRMNVVEVTLMETNQLLVPGEIDSIHNAISSYLIDPGDSVLVSPGLYELQSFSFEGKNITVKSTDGAKETLIKWKPSYNNSGKYVPDSTFIKMTAGKLVGFGILEGIAAFGGGIFATGTANVRNCILNDNYSGRSIHTSHGDLGGKGGSIYLSGSALVENSILMNDSLLAYDTGVYVDENAENVRIINCTLINNDIKTESENFTIQNSIFTINDIWKGDHPPRMTSGILPTISYSYTNEQWVNHDSTNLIGELLFNSFPYDLRLMNGSVGIDAGNPDPYYNDIDGTRNDIGAYGGKFGNW
jgi:hypothetical protein